MKYLVIFLIMLSNYAHAHPVIFKGGWVYQGSFMPLMNEMKVSYTFDPKWSVVLNSHRFEMADEYQDVAIGLNTLVKRWLQHDSQGNVYLGAHFGKYQDLAGDGSVGHAFLMADWEDREDYVVFKSKKFYFEDRQSQDYLIRYGFAPYVAGMNELQTWMILQAYYYEEQSKEAIITPMLRFFYKNVLWELGSSTKGDSFLTLMVHY
jgi:hypothetical protein